MAALRAVRRAAVVGCAILLPFQPSEPTSSWRVAQAQAQPADAAENAFAAAKELGTADAWNAFLANYPTGFHADLARAYLVKLKAAPPLAAEATAPARPAQELACSQARKLKSKKSDDAVKIRFVNESEATIVLQWIDFDGSLKEYGEVPPGAQLTQDTFLTHPWIAAYQEGSCRQLFLPEGELSVARLRPEKDLRDATRGSAVETDEGSEKKSEKNKAADKPSKATVEKRAKAACVDIGMIYLNGQCAPKSKAERGQAAKNKGKACPAGMYRNPYGQCQPNETGG